MVGELDLVEENDQFTHMMTLEDAVNSEDLLSEYRPCKNSNDQFHRSISIEAHFSNIIST